MDRLFTTIAYVYYSADPFAKVFECFELIILLSDPWVSKNRNWTKTFPLIKTVQR